MFGRRTTMWGAVIAASLLIILSACTYSTPTPTSVWPTAHIQMQAQLPLYWEDFEDGDLDQGVHWNFHGVSYHQKEVMCGGGGLGEHGCFLLMDGPIASFSLHRSGVYSHLGEYYIGIEPDFISFYIFTWSSPGTHTGYFELSGRNPNPNFPYDRNIGILFYFDTNGLFWVNGSNYGSFTRDHWHHIEFKNITWERPWPMFNFYVDGSLQGECIHFLEPLETLEYLEVYNFDPGYVGYDEILMDTSTEAALDDSCAPPPPPPQPSVTEAETETQTPPPPPPTEAYNYTGTATMNANCRAGPATAYNETGFVPEGFTAQIEGRNEESTWLYIQTPNGEGHCWVSAITFEADINYQNLPVVAASALPPTEAPVETQPPEPEPQCCTVKSLSSAELKCTCPCPANAMPGQPCSP